MISDHCYMTLEYIGRGVLISYAQYFKSVENQNLPVLATSRYITSIVQFSAMVMLHKEFWELKSIHLEAIKVVICEN